MDGKMRQKLQQWHEAGQFDQIVETLTQISEEEMDYELIGMLSRALNNQGKYEEALDLLDGVEEEGSGDALWFFRRGYALYGLRRYAEAKLAFERVTDLDSGDQDAPQYIQRCRDNLAYPVRRKTFRSRVAEFWEAFSEREAELRQKMDCKEDKMPSVELASELLDASFEEAYFEMGHNGQKYELILSAEGELQRLFRLEYWKQHAPEALLDHWNFIVGRPPVENAISAGITMYNCSVDVKSVKLWVEELEEKKVGLSMYSESLLPLLMEDENKAYSLMTILVDQCIGEVSAIRHVEYLDILDKDAAPEASGNTVITGPMMLSELRMFIQGLHGGDRESSEGLSSLCESFSVYHVEPKVEDWVLREDVFIGSSCCMPVVHEYYCDNTDIVEENEQEGVIFGFLYYNNDKVPQEDMVAFRGSMEDEITQMAGDSGQILGGATGNVYSYIDCICYDLNEFLDVAGTVMSRRALDEIAFHVFRKDCGGIDLRSDSQGEESVGNAEKNTKENEVGEGMGEGQTGIMSEELRSRVEAWGEEGYMHRILSLLCDLPGAEKDLEVCLWIAYAYINIDEYAGYVEAEKWLSGVAAEGKTSGVWNYRYSVALSYLGRFDEALQYACQGTEQEPEYPWTYLQLAKMYYQQDNKAAALQTIDEGLQLVPEDYEFLTLKQEIEAGEDLSVMMSHYIDAEVDQEFGGQGRFEKLTQERDAYESQPDEEEDQEDGEDGESGGMHFQGFVLLDSVEIDMAHIMDTLESEWGIVPGGEFEEDTPENDADSGDDSITKVFFVGKSMVAVSLMPGPIPKEEVEYYAETNYMWKEAVLEVKKHQAHILVAVMPKGESMIEAGKLFVKVASACLQQENALAIYTSGTVFQPEFYLDVAGLMKEEEDALPVLDWIYFGLYRDSDGKNCAYTYGLTTFGKDEIEVLASQKTLEELRDFLFQISCYIIDCDVTLLDGETIGFTEDQKLAITRSQAVGIEGMSLKIEY